MDFGNINVVFNEIKWFLKQSNIDRSNLDEKMLQLTIGKESLQNKIDKKKQVMVESIMDEHIINSITHSFCWV